MQTVDAKLSHDFGKTRLQLDRVGLHLVLGQDALLVFLVCFSALFVVTRG